MPATADPDVTETTDEAAVPDEATTSAPDGPLAGKTVLLVDDDFDVLQTLEAAFEPMGCKILSTRNGNKAIELAERESPDLLILDMMLPGRSGFLVLEKLKADKLPSEKPYIIMLTGNEGLRHQQYAEARGVNDYFHKPASLEKLLARSEELLRDQG
jgi:DNA-binding response OmpR family regulator